MKKTFKSKIIIAGAVLVVLLAVGAFAVYKYAGVSADTVTTKVYGYRVNTDVSKGEVFSSDIKYLESRPVRQVKLTAIPKSAAYRFDRWEADKKQCTFLDKTKAITVAKIGHGCKITAVFKDVAMESSHEGYEEICKPSDFDKIRNNLSGKFVQTCDIDMAGIDFVPIGSNGDNSGNILPGDKRIFTGVYDGDGKVIIGLNINSNTSHTGLFKASSGTIINTTIDGLTINSTERVVGGIVGGNLESGTISNSITKGKIVIDKENSENNIDYTNLSNFGGIVGENFGQVQDCKSKIDIKLPTNYKISINAGGIAGSNKGGLIESSYSAGSIRDISRNGGGIAGINLGRDRKAIVSNSFSSLNIIGINDKEDAKWGGNTLGGLVGRTEGKWIQGAKPSPSEYSEVKNSYALGDITGTAHIGGLIGHAYFSNMIDSTYTYGNTLTASYGFTGGLIGHYFGDGSKPGSTISNSSANTNIIVIDNGRLIGGFVGSFQSSAVIERSTAISRISSLDKSKEDADLISTSNIGGFAGMTSGQNGNDLEIKESSANTLIDLPNAVAVGGFIGQAFGSRISNSYSRGTITANNASGFIDAWRNSIEINSNNIDTTSPNEPTGQGNWNDPATSDYTIYNNYSNIALRIVGDRTSSNAYGGFIRNYYGSDLKVYLKNNYWNRDIAGTTFSAYGTAKTTQEMKDKSTYVGWDFNSIWNILPNKNSGYPFLRK